MQKHEYQLMFENEDTHWWFKGKRAFLRTTLKKFTPRERAQASQNILDVGCGTGANMVWLSKFGKVHGVDLSDDALRFASQRNLQNLTKGSALSLPFGDASMDGVTLIDMLYHQWVEDESKVLKEVHRVLKPGGWVMITDSALEYLKSQHDEAVMARVRFNRKDLAKTLEKTGFEVQFSSYWNFFLFPVILLTRLLEKRKSHHSGGGVKSNVGKVSKPLNTLLYGVLNLESSLIRWVRYPVGSSVILFARKR